jgi:hypothetical protein
MAVQPPLTAQEPPPEQSQEITRPTEEQRSDEAIDTQASQPGPIGS